MTRKLLKNTYKHQRLSCTAYDELKAQYKAMKYLELEEVDRLELMYRLHNGLDRQFAGTLSQNNINAIITEILTAIEKEKLK